MVHGTLVTEPFSRRRWRSAARFHRHDLLAELVRKAAALDPHLFDGLPRYARYVEKTAAPPPDFRTGRRIDLDDPPAFACGVVVEHGLLTPPGSPGRVCDDDPLYDTCNKSL